MRHHRLTEGSGQRYDADGNLEWGALMVGEDRVVRWFTRDELAAMEGIGEYSGSTGYVVYEDRPKGQARMAGGSPSPPGVDQWDAAAEQREKTRARLEGA